MNSLWVTCVTALCLWAAPLSVAADLAELEQQALDAAADAVADSVVQIRTIGGLEQIDQQVVGQGPTTGLIVTADGYIVSSAFNFAQEPTSILVRLPSGQQRPAEMIGRDTNRMLVLLKVEADEPLPTVDSAPLEEVRPGDWAVALGRTYRDDQVSVSVGVVSALDRMHGRVLQTDANVSVANYGGPLVDVRGRVLGILVPMAPPAAGGGTESSAVAGAEFYDSGIGFAVPLSHVLNVLDRWKEEKELKRGVLGVSLKPGNPHATPPIVSAVWPGSPAGKAEWEKGDRILAVDGVKVATQTDLRFQIAPRYAKDRLDVTIRRGKGKDAEEIETEVALVDKLPAFRHAFLGILPERSAREAAPADDDGTAAESHEGEDSDDGDDEDEEEGAASKAPSTTGVVVRSVWPDSPADKAGLRPDDRITKLGDEQVNSSSEAIAQLNAKAPDAKLAVEYFRSDDERKADVELTELPVDILSASDLATTSDESDDGEGAEPKLEELKLPEMPQTARYYQPPEKESPLGLLIWLVDGQEASAQAMAEAWQATCRRDGLVLLMPEPADATGWSTDDLEYLARLLQTAVRRFDVDPARVVIAGESKAGQLAYALAFPARKLIRGVAVIDSPLPRTLELPENSPNERLAVLSVETQNTPLSLLIRQDLRKLTEAGYPTTQIVRRGEDDRRKMLDAATRAKIARWIDGLDRF